MPTLQVYTVATLPSAATKQGEIAYVSDSDRNGAYAGSVAVGGGISRARVLSDGTSWRIYGSSGSTVSAAAVSASAATLSAVNKNSGIAITGSGLIATASAGATRSGRGTTATTAITTGNKYYMEFVFTGGSASDAPGFVNASATFNDNDFPGMDTNGFAWFQNGTRGYNNTFPSGLPSWSLGNTLGIAIDFTAGLWWPKVSGTFTGDPTAGTGGQTIPAITGVIYPAYDLASSGSMTFNPNATPPSGFTKIP